MLKLGEAYMFTKFFFKAKLNLFTFLHQSQVKNTGNVTFSISSCINSMFLRDLDLQLWTGKPEHFINCLVDLPQHVHTSFLGGKAFHIFLVNPIS